MSGYPHNVPGYGYGQPPPPQPYSTPYGAAPPPSSSPYGAPPPPSSSPYGAPPPQSYSSAPYGAPVPPQSHSPYAPVPSPYSTGAPSYGSDPHKPPKENKPQSYGGYPAPPPSAPYGDPNKPPKDNNPHAAAPYGGYHAPAPYGATSPFASLVPSAFPPGTDPNVIACFQLADQDGSGLIDDKELQKALSSYNQSFSLRTVHLLMYLFTNTNTRKIGPKEFTSVFYSLQEWRGIFERFDRDRSGRIDSSELRDALLSLGYAVSPPILDLLVSKFDKTGGKNKAIEYDNFIECCLTVKGLTDKFKEKDTSYSGSATFSYESFMLTVLPFLIA
ncbi:PREDICTED: probable calcium-binding protein CML49 [Nicotiana attenuata]|uniref:Calcium-binding protein cml49 n=1 Tax=Nicotiana attenuata TaxID=49451 RepID=A0A1J6KSR2_NICAT|nr:PREDICTED: probable calcium-binding protein CML49 [Nicotiana attenuata]OIT27816.1 putative calcium-binding protein cml49 [Nicotiana attenuata]